MKTLTANQNPSDFKELKHLKQELCVGVDSIVIIIVTIVLSVNAFIVEVFSANTLLSIFTTNSIERCISMQLGTHLKFYISPVKLYCSENTLSKSWKVRLLFLMTAIFNIMHSPIHPNILAKFRIACYSYKLCHRSSMIVCFSENQAVSLLCLFSPSFTWQSVFSFLFFRV